jgi:hypothetical protein
LAAQAVRPPTVAEHDRARASDPGSEARAAANHGWALEVWLGAKVDEHPQPVLRLRHGGSSSTDPNAVDVGVVGHVVAAIGHRRGYRKSMGHPRARAGRRGGPDPRDVAVVAFVMWPSRKARYEDAARLPIREDD